MSPTIFREAGFRFFFFSREESRVHVHVSHSDGEAKFWLEPLVELANSIGLSQQQLNKSLQLVEVHADEIRTAWRNHFSH